MRPTILTQYYYVIKISLNIPEKNIKLVITCLYESLDKAFYYKLWV